MFWEHHNNIDAIQWVNLMLHLVGLVWLHDESVAWRAPLFKAMHDHHKSVRSGLRPDVDARVLPPQQVLDERRLACTQSQPPKSQQMLDLKVHNAIRL